MRTRSLFFTLPIAALAFAAAPDGWPHWRGPNADGMARGDAPLHWTDKEHVAWKASVPGRGFSSPIVWGDRIFLTTAVPTADASARGLVEHKFTVLSYDRKSDGDLQAVFDLPEAHVGPLRETARVARTVFRYGTAPARCIFESKLVRTRRILLC